MKLSLFYALNIHNNEGLGFILINEEIRSSEEKSMILFSKKEEVEVFDGQCFICKIEDIF